MKIEVYIISDIGEKRGVFRLENYHNRYVWKFSRFLDSNITRIVIKRDEDIAYAVDNLRWGTPLILPFEEKDLLFKEEL